MKEAMKLALEALEGIHPGNMTPMAEDAWNKSITALRQAKEQAEQAQPVAYPPLPEPVADWVQRGSISTGGGSYGREVKREGVYTAAQMHAYADAARALYTAPPAERKLEESLAPRPVAEPHKPLPIEPKHETNDGGWAVSAGGYCNIFFCEDDADDWIIKKGGDPHDPTTYTKRELVEKRQPLTDEQIKDVAASCMWWVREQDILEDAIELARAIEAAHGITKENT